MDEVTAQAQAWLKKVKYEDTGDYDPLITYYFVNKSLNMSSGKIGVQTARAGQVMLLGELEHSDSLLFSSLNELFVDKFMHGNKSICLRANDSQMRRLLDGDLRSKLTELTEQAGVPLRLYPVYDIGATEVATNSLTVIGLTPIRKSIISPFTRKFNLY